MAPHPLAGKPAPTSLLADIPALLRAYEHDVPDPRNPEQAISFGTSGHRGSSLKRTFNDAHIAAVSQAVADYRKEKGIDGPLFVGIDTHALSKPALTTAIEVLAANDVALRIASEGAFTPTPAVSHAIIDFNAGRTSHFADGIVVTPSHNPPEDGGFKYNPPHGGPASGEVTSEIQQRANALLLEGNRSVRRMPFERAVRSEHVTNHDFQTPYVRALRQVIDMDAIRSAGVKLGADPMGGASISYWGSIRDEYGLDLDVVNTAVDPTFSFMTLDHDGKIRMDCSSPYAMQRLIALKERFDVAFGNDADADRHGIVTRSGLMNPNHFLCTCAAYLMRNRPRWAAGTGLGKTVVSTSLLDRIANDIGRPLVEVPVGFKWFVKGLMEGTIGFAGEESAGASLLRQDGTVWTTDKDGIVACLLAAEITAKTGRPPSEHYAALAGRLGEPVYERIDAPANRAQRKALENLSESDVDAETLAGEPIVGRLTRAPGNGAKIGGLKVTTTNGWFAARPSGTEDVYKIYSESFLGRDHLTRLLEEARTLVQKVLESKKATP